MKEYDKAFITGCDKRTEWMLEWFVNNYKKHNDAPMIFANFGVSDEMLEKIYQEKMFHAVVNLSKAPEEGWFKKPLAMYNCPAKDKIWLDTDCEIKANLDEMFDLLEPNKLSMVKDHPWTKRRGEVWHNSGVVGIIGKPKILQDWMIEIRNRPTVGDQETLHAMLNPILKIRYINELPHKYNVLRIDLIDGKETQDAAIIHWTGRKGKDHIKSLIEGNNG